MNRTLWYFAAGMLLALTVGGCSRSLAVPQGAASPKAEAVVLGDKTPAKADPLAPWPMFGGTPWRNMVNLVDKNTPVTWNVEAGKQKNIKWVAKVGSRLYGGPVIADGKVFVGTNNANPRDKKVGKGHKAILMAFNEADGQFLWQIVHDFPADGVFDMAQSEGLCCTPTLEGKRLYYSAPGAIVCADTSGKVQWNYDMMKELEVIPFHVNISSPLVVGDLVLVNTGNGVNEDGKVASPKAPSFIALNKNTGKLEWQSNLPGKNIIEGQWSNPALAVVDGKPQVIFAGGDCVMYGLEPKTGNVIWQCDCNPERKPGGRKVENYMTATPVIVGDRLFIGLGTYPEHPSPAKPYAYVLCLDISKKGDVSFKSYNAKDAQNKGSALVWAFGGPLNPPPARGRDVIFGRTISTASVHDGLVFITDDASYVYCLDAKTGTRYWERDLKGAIWGSPYSVDGKVYVNLDDGDVYIFKQAKECQFYAEGKWHAVAKASDKVEAAASMDEAQVHSTPVVANGVLYIATPTKLYAIK